MFSLFTNDLDYLEHFDYVWHVYSMYGVQCRENLME
jgi:hypothetical protein